MDITRLSLVDHDVLSTIRQRAKKATRGPWQYGVSYTEYFVNDGTHPTWKAPADIPVGQCAGCLYIKDAPLVQEKKRQGKPTLHIHQQSFNTGMYWQTITSASTFRQIVGSYDYEAGGVSSSKDNADFIAHAREDIPLLLDTIERLEKLLEKT